MSPRFLTLSTEVSEPFVIPNVSPVSSPKMQAISPTIEALPASALPEAVSPLVVVDEPQDDATLLSEGSMSIVELN
ncbi:uncharacterized protein RJT20DRAFT_124222 [Scheffersomyces xylosifermentans]|uniref:uncharacterized protein n=1 Tax=Scheffersomyces xylosifermentans TaxID=1304137 RepID=UPI00315DCEF8